MISLNPRRSFFISHYLSNTCPYALHFYSFTKNFQWNRSR